MCGDVETVGLPPLRLVETPFTRLRESEAEAPLVPSRKRLPNLLGRPFGGAPFVAFWIAPRTGFFGGGRRGSIGEARGRKGEDQKAPVSRPVECRLPPKNNGQVGSHVVIGGQVSWANSLA